jgi:hypothetical protein
MRDQGDFVVAVVCSDAQNVMRLLLHKLGLRNAVNEPEEEVVLFRDEHPHLAFPSVLHAVRRGRGIIAQAYVPNHLDMLFTLAGLREKADIPGEATDLTIRRRSSKSSIKRTWGSMYVAKQEAMVGVFMFLLPCE